MSRNPPRITKRETEIAKLVMLGFANKEIARRLRLSPRTIDQHATNIKAKTGSRNKGHLTAYLILNGLVSVTIEELEAHTWHNPNS